VVSVAALLEEANEALASSTDQTYLEALKNVLASANGSSNFYPL
jgi:hypothetical protein